MAIELARCLVQGGVVTAVDMEAALFESVNSGVPLLRVLSGRLPAAAKLLERELGRLGKFALDTVDPDFALCRRLPRGLCERLLAVPVTKAEPELQVDVAVADPFDLHARDELAFHLGRTVRLLQAPLGELFAATETLAFNPSERPPGPEPADEDTDDRTPAFGTARLPLFARSDLSPSAGRLGRPRSAVEAEPRFGPEPSSEPIPLVRTATNPPGLANQTASLPERLDATVNKLEAAQSPRAVINLLVDGLSAVAGKIAIFSVHGKRFSGKTANAALGGDAGVASLELDAAESRLFGRALEAGHVLEPLRELGDKRLSDLMGARGEEVYAARIDVSGRPALLLLLGAMTNAFVASQHADRLTRSARSALQRIVLAKKLR